MRLGSLGPVELILIILAIVLIFGASKLGDIGGALGKSVREFRKESDADRDKRLAAEAETNTAAIAPSATTVVVEEKKDPVGVGDFRPPDNKPS
jgi:sec-independent protein translocase protein TatA